MGAGPTNRSAPIAGGTVRNRAPGGSRSMNENIDITEIDVDELWIREWAEIGLAELERYLARQAAFAEYLRQRGDR